jgi:selenocysteine lyase/cysteine desulfurase
MNVAQIRKSFPITEKWNYLNHAVVSPLPTYVRDAIVQFLYNRVTDGGISYTEWFKEVESSRSVMGNLLKTSGNNIAFFNNTSHAMNTISDILPLKKDDEILISDLEFPSNTFPWVKQQSKGIGVKWLRSHNGILDISDIKRALTENTKVIAISHVCYYNGYKVDVEALSDLAQERDLILVIDAMQSLGALEIDLHKLNIDFLASNSYKWLLGPFGIATLYCKENWISKLSPNSIGWYSAKDIWSRELEQFIPADTARRFETGHPNFEGIKGIRASVEFMLQIGTRSIEDRVIALNTKIREELGLIKEVEILSPSKDISGITLFRVPRIDSAKVVNILRAKGIVVFSQRWKDGIGVKVSPHFYNTEEEVEEFLKGIKDLTCTNN